MRSGAGALASESHAGASPVESATGGAFAGPNLRAGGPSVPLLLSCLFFAIYGTSAEEKKDEKKPEPPRVVVAVPLGIVPGTTNTIKLRGLNLTNATTLRFLAAGPSAEVRIKSAGKVEVPKDQDSKKLGDTQLEVELTLPSGTPFGAQPFVVVTPDGESQTNSLLVLDGSSLVKEKEPNDGFRQPQPIQLGQTVQGVIAAAYDVDVFRFDGRVGQRIIAEVTAARQGSPLDAILTLYDSAGRTVAINDDSEAGMDSILRATLPADGAYFLSLMDAHDRGGPAHVYLLAARVAP